MSRFTTHLGLTLLEYSNGRAVMRDGLCLWYLRDPLVYEVGELGSGVFITVPAFNPDGQTDKALSQIRCRGVTDLGSVPWFARRLVSPMAPEAKAFVLHDDGYVTKGWGGRCTREGVDDLLFEASGVLGSPMWRRQLVHASVRVGGWKGWGT